MSAAEFVEFRNAVAAIAALIGSLACLAYVLTPQRRKAKKPVYLLLGIFFFYLACVYTSTFIAALYFVRSGWASVIGVILLMFAVIMLILTDWRIDADGRQPHGR